MKVIEEPPPRKPRLWVGALATVALVLVGLGVRLAVGRLPATPVAPPVVVVWALNSDPPNAQVLRKKDGKELCRTPCVQEPEPGGGRLPVIFRAPGYADEEVELDESKPFARPVKLRPEPAGLPPTVPEVPAKEPIGTVAGSAPTGPEAVAPSRPTPDPVAVPTRPDPVAVPTRTPPRGATEPIAVKPVKPPAVGPRRTGRPNDSLLTDDKITIIQ
jgi:hypothetical protein